MSQASQTGATAVIETVMQIQTYVLTPTVVPVTIQSSTVITGSNGQVSTLDASYVTLAAVLNNLPSSTSNEDDDEDRLAVGLSLGLSLPISAALVAFMWWYWLRHRRAMQTIRSNNKNSNNTNINASNGFAIAPAVYPPSSPPSSSSQAPQYNGHGPTAPEKLPTYTKDPGTYV
ncbi:hypothetical protein FRC17_008904 [Serendipita sp. 399]|nr:hypothetical protein FRC17_008904 [Serendipita sp. 399]